MKRGKIKKFSRPKQKRFVVGVQSGDLIGEYSGMRDGKIVVLLPSFADGAVYLDPKNVVIVGRFGLVHRKTSRQVGNLMNQLRAIETRLVKVALRTLIVSIAIFAANNSANVEWHECPWFTEAFT